MTSNRYQQTSFLFGLAPDALPSPHRAMQWTVGRYSLFLDESTDVVVWQLINDNCVRAFAAANPSDGTAAAMLEVGALVEQSK